MEKKRHHYIAQAYLRHFCNERGKLCVYSKDKNGESWFADPDSTAVEKYYYSQPKPDGGRDNNRLEDFFSKIETKWTPLVRQIENHEQPEGGLQALLEFVLMHRVRVPTARNTVERMLAESVRMTGRHLYECGELPPPPGYTYEELERLTVISIDPHRSILAMADLAEGMSKIFDAIGLEILENTTNEEFITSDNPVVCFDPTVSEAFLQPYMISRERMDIEFLFPITPKFLLWGHTALKGQRHCVPYRCVSEQNFVSRANRFVARFANRHVFSGHNHYCDLVKKYAATSPVVAITHIKTRTGRGIVARSVFGKRDRMPKWKGTTEDGSSLSSF